MLGINENQIKYLFIFISDSNKFVGGSFSIHFTSSCYFILFLYNGERDYG